MFIVQVAGNLGKDPEVRFTPNGQKVTTFNIAVNQRKNKEEVTIWVRITVWGDRLDKIISYLKKGSGVIVIGRLNPPTTYVDKEGRTQVTLEVTAEMIEFSPFGRTDRAAEGQSGTYAPSQSYNQTQQQGSNQAYGAHEQVYAKAPAPAYGSHAVGQGSHDDSMDEDQLPF